MIEMMMMIMSDEGDSDHYVNADEEKDANGDVNNADYVNAGLNTIVAMRVTMVIVMMMIVFFCFRHVR